MYDEAFHSSNQKCKTASKGVYLITLLVLSRGILDYYSS